MPQDTPPAPGTAEHLRSFMSLIHQQARFCFRRLPQPRTYDYKDLLQEGIVVYLKLVPDYVPDRARFITPFYQRLTQHFGKLLDRAMRKWCRKLHGLDLNLFVAKARPEPRLTSLFAQRPSVEALLFARAMSQGAAGLVLPKKANPVTRRKAVFEFLGIPRERRSDILNEIRLKVGSRALG